LALLAAKLALEILDSALSGTEPLPQLDSVLKLASQPVDRLVPSRDGPLNALQMASQPAHLLIASSDGPLNAL